MLTNITKQGFRFWPHISDDDHDYTLMDWVTNLKALMEGISISLKADEHKIVKLINNLDNINEIG